VLRILHPPGYHIFYSPPRYGQEWQAKALVAYLVAHGDKALPFLLLQTKKVRNDRIYDIHRGAVFCIGEIGSSKAIPALREALQSAKNSSTRLELIFALAKSGDKDVAVELLEHKVGSLDHQLYVDRLLRQLTGKSFGSIEDEASGKDVFDGWQEFLNRKDDAQPDAAEQPATAGQSK
jgi:HEAT repeat protein